MSEAGKSREHGYFEKGVIMNDKKTWERPVFYYQNGRQVDLEKSLDLFIEESWTFIQMERILLKRIPEVGHFIVLNYTFEYAVK